MASPYSSFDPIQSISIASSQKLVALAHRDRISVVKLTPNEISDHSRISPNFKGAFTLTDVLWCPQDDSRLAVSTTSGSLAVVDISYSTGKKFSQSWEADNTSSRSINKICWRVKDKHILASAFQDGQIKIYDSRLKKSNCILSLASRSDTVAIRDISFDPFHEQYLSSVSDNGNLLVWDLRSAEAPLSRIASHSTASQTLAYSLSQEYRLATGGRDKTIKVWDLSSIEETAHYIRPTHMISSSASVAKVRWRPDFPDQLACSLVEKSELVVYDINMPNLGVSVLCGHSEACSDFDWVDTPLEKSPKDTDGSSPRKSIDLCHMQLYQHILSADKEGKLLVQDLRNGFFPRQHISGSVAALSNDGMLAFHGGVIDRVSLNLSTTF